MDDAIDKSVKQNALEEIPKDRYCSPAIHLENCYAFFVELESLEGARFEFMFWRGDRILNDFKFDKPRIRDLRPGDTVVYQGIYRRVARVEIFR